MTSPGGPSDESHPLTHGSSEALHAALAHAISSPSRLDALESTGLLDTPPEAAFDRLTQLARRMLRAPVALVSLVDNNRQFFKSASGTTQGGGAIPVQSPLDYSFCKHTLASPQPFLVEDSLLADMVRGNRAIEELGVRAYAGIPLITGRGHTLGSFCAIDFAPRAWTEDDVSILQDLAAATLTEIELRIAARELRASLSALERTEAQRDNLMRMVVHDLRTPLSSYLVGLQGLDVVGPLNRPQQEMLKIAIAGGWSLQRMIDDLLDIARLESLLHDQGEVNRSAVDVPQLIERALDQVRQLGVSGDLKLHAAIDPSVGPVEADESLLERVIVNLLGNAVKFTPAGGAITIEVTDCFDSDRPVEHEAAGSAAKFTEFRVRDTGPGIPRQDFDGIFQLFGQASNFVKAARPSSGIGLAFCRLAAQAHGGSITVESELGQGSTFIVRLPR